MLGLEFGWNFVSEKILSRENLPRSLLVFRVPRAAGLPLHVLGVPASLGFGEQNNKSSLQVVSFKHSPNKLPSKKN